MPQAAPTCVAHVHLRSLSGRSYRELGHGPVPTDLSPYKPPPGAHDVVGRFFVQQGFAISLDETALTVFIEGPPDRFVRTFGITKKSLAEVSAAKTRTLRPPAEIRDLVEEIVLAPPPELFR